MRVAISIVVAVLAGNAAAALGKAGIGKKRSTMRWFLAEGVSAAHSAAINSPARPKNASLMLFFQKEAEPSLRKGGPRRKWPPRMIQAGRSRSGPSFWTPEKVRKCGETRAAYEQVPGVSSRGSLRLGRAGEASP